MQWLSLDASTVGKQMKSNSYIISINYLIFGLAMFLANVHGSELNLTSFEMEPYVGSHLEQEGAISEIIASAFAESGNSIKISYLPPARAKSVRNDQKYYGTFPVVENTVSNIDFTLSDPLPGIKLGLLKKKNNNEIPSSYDSKLIGVVRGTVVKIAKPKFKNAIIIEVNNLEQLIKMLDVGRLDYVLIDKYTAANLIVNTLPYLIGKLDFVPDSNDYLSVHLAFYNRNTADSAQLLQAFNLGLEKINASGIVNKILYKHGLLEFTDTHDRKTIRIATVDNKELLMMKEMSHLYQAQRPDIKLEWRVLDESVLRQRLMSDLAVSSGEFDIMTIGAYEAKLWAEKGWLYPIKNLKLDYDLADIVPSIKASMSYQNTLYALPFYAESSMTYYRKDLFDAAKIKMPHQPTWSEILSMAKKLNDKNNGVSGICLRGKPSWGENVALITTIVNSFGGQWFNHDWQPQLTSKEWQSAVSLYIDLLQNYGPDNAHTLGYQENLKLFSQGKCAIWVDATVAASTLYNPKISNVYNKIGFASAPSETTDKGASWLWTWGLAIPASSNYYEQALDFIQWVTSKSYIKDVAQYHNWLSIPPGTRFSTYNNPNYYKNAPFSGFVLNEIISVSSKQAAIEDRPYNSIQFVDTPEFPAIGNFFGRRISKVLSKEKSLMDALIETQEFAELQVKHAKK